MVIDPEAADTVRLIFGMYAEKKSLVDIERVLYEEKRLNPLAWKKQRRGEAVDEEFQYVWQKVGILSLMRDEQYLGTYLAGKTKPAQLGSRSRVRVSEDKWIRIPNNHPAIISQDLFDAVREQLRLKGEPLRRRELTTAKRYAAEVTSPLNHKAVCGHCGHSLRIRCTKNAAFHCWYTRAADGAACHKLRIPKGELEGVVLKSIKRQAKLVAAAGLRSADIRALSHPAAAEYLAGIEKLKNEKHLLYESLILGVIDSNDYKSRKTAIDIELDESLRVYGAIIDEKQKACRTRIPCRRRRRL